MKLKVITGMVLTLFLIATLTLVFNVQLVEASGTIYIRADGSVDPPTANITSVDNVTYAFADNINDSIVVERDNIVVDGAGHVLEGTGTPDSKGIDLTRRCNVTIKNMEIKAFWYGIWLHSSLNNNIAGNKITNNDNDGIYLWNSSNNAISGNNLTNNKNGLGLVVSSNNTMESNNVTTNKWTGVYLYASSNNVLRGNNLSLNKYNFGVYGLDLSQLINDVDVSNFVNGKPIYYLINQRNLTIDPVGFPAVGYLALVNSTNITVKNLNLTQNWEGILLGYTRDSTIESNNIINNLCGVWLGWSSDNTIKSNNIAAKGPFSDGIYLEGSSDNTIKSNSITNNDYGIHLYEASNNRIYHNNFIDNTQQVYIEVYGYTNLWDNGVEGNYWSSYTRVDLDHNGIGDTKHVIDANNIDNYPLMGMFHSFNASLGYAVNIISNSTIEDFQYFESNSTIRMHVSNMTENQTFGFCRVCIPKVLVPPPYTVVIDDGLTEVLYFNDTVYDNGTHRWIYFAYEHSTHKVVIVPEFPAWTSILLILILLTFATAIYKRRLPQTRKTA